MLGRDIWAELQQITSAEDFAEKTIDLTESWRLAGVGLEVVEPILRFMEDHPTVDFGAPGALVHFVEQFHHRGYEKLLLQSIQRRPTVHTAWMLNRVINGENSPADRQLFISALQQARDHGSADQSALEQIERHLARLSAGG